MKASGGYFFRVHPSPWRPPTRPGAPSSARCQGECCYTENKLSQLLHREQAVSAVPQRTCCLSCNTENKLSHLLHREQAVLAVTQKTSCLSCYTESKLSQLLHREQAGSAVTHTTSCLSCYTENDLSQLFHRKQAVSAVLTAPTATSVVRWFCCLSVSFASAVLNCPCFPNCPNYFTYSNYSCCPSRP